MTWIYNELSKELSYLSENYANGVWVNNQSRKNTYDTRGNQLTQLKEKWKAEVWESEVRYTWTYFETSSRIQSYLYEIFSNKVFSNYERFACTYNEKGEMLTKLSDRWSKSDWVPANRYTWTYDANGNILTDLIERWQPEEWSMVSSFLWAYDKNGNSSSLVKAGSTGAAYLNYNNMQSKYNITAAGFAKTIADYVDVNEKVAISVSSIALNDTILELEVGNTFQLKAIVTPKNATNKDVSWNSSNGNVKVNDTGLITAVSGGTSVISVTTLDGGFTATCNVSVKLVAVEKIALNISELDIKVGETFSLLPIITPKDATNQSVKWESSKSQIAMISSSGLLTAISTGETVITVTTDDGGFTATCNVEVVMPVTKITLNKATVDMRVGDTCRLIANISPSNATNKAVLWTSSDNSLLTVKEGLITAIASGNAIITATSVDTNLSATCSFKIGTISIDDLDNKYINVFFKKDQILIDANVSILKVYVYDIKGRLIYEGNNANPIYTQTWVDGMYIIKVAAAHNLFETKKIIVK